MIGYVPQPVAQRLRGSAAALLGGTVLGGLPRSALPRRRRPRRARPRPRLAARRTAAGHRSARSRSPGAQRLEPETIRQLHPPASGPALYRRPRPTRRSRTSTRPSCSPTSSIAQRRRRRGDHGGRKTRSSTASCWRATSASRTTRSCPRSSSRRGRSSPAPRSAPTSPASSSSTSARAASPPRSSRRWSQLDQNRVDIVFEINEGPKSKVRQINIIGNEKFSDGELQRRDGHQGVAALTRFFSSGTSYDPDRLAFDQQKLRQFYLTEGLCRFPRGLGGGRADARQARLHHHLRGRGRASATSSATSKVDSQLRDFDGDALTKQPADEDGRLVQRQAGRRHDRAAAPSSPAPSATPSPTCDPQYRARQGRARRWTSPS